MIGIWKDLSQKRPGGCEERLAVVAVVVIKWVEIRHVCVCVCF